MSRPQGSACDLGAYEAEPAAVPEPGPTRTLNLRRGFALLGWTGADTPVAAALGAISGAVGGVWTWDQGTESFRFFGPTAPAFLNTLQTLRYGGGFWILLTRDVVWEMPVWLP